MYKLYHRLPPQLRSGICPFAKTLQHHKERKQPEHLWLITSFNAHSPFLFQSVQNTPTHLHHFYTLCRENCLLFMQYFAALSAKLHARTLIIQHAPWLSLVRPILSCRTAEQYFTDTTSQSPKSCVNPCSLFYSGIPLKYMKVHLKSDQL